MCAQHPEIVSKSHLTLVTPWPCSDCPHASWLVRQAGSGIIGPRYGIGMLLGTLALNLGPLTFSGPDALHKAAEAFTRSERVEFSRMVEADDSWAARRVAAMQSNFAASTTEGFAGDIQVCLASWDELGLPKGSADGRRGRGAWLPARVSVFGASDDELVPMDACAWLCGWMAEAGAAVRMIVCDDGTHNGTQRFRRAAYLEGAYRDGDLCALSANGGPPRWAANATVWAKLPPVHQLAPLDLPSSSASLGGAIGASVRMLSDFTLSMARPVCGALGSVVPRALRGDADAGVAVSAPSSEPVTLEL